MWATERDELGVQYALRYRIAAEHEPRSRQGGCAAAIGTCEMMNGEQLVTRLGLPPTAIVNALVVLIATLTVSCGSDASTEESTWAGEVQRLPGGAVLVSNPAAGVWHSQAGWRIEETLRIGSPEGQGPDVFGRITAIEVDTAGRIYVFDGFARELRVFGPDGDFVTSVGRRGAGPGEFEGVVGMSLSPDGAIWLVDPENARYAAIQGDDFEMHRRDAPLYRLPWVGGFTAEGVLYDAVVLPGQGRAGESLLRVGPAGAVTDTLPIATPELDVPRRGSMTFPLPYAPRVLRTFDPRGFVWTAVTHEYRLVNMSLRGDTVTIVTRDYAPPALTSAQQDSVRRYVRRLEAEFRVDVRGSMIPRSAPILRWFLVDDRAPRQPSALSAVNSPASRKSDPRMCNLLWTGICFRPCAVCRLASELSSRRTRLATPSWFARTSWESGTRTMVWVRAGLGSGNRPSQATGGTPSGDRATFSKEVV
ncbi:MAG: 6-bladed beta-propeller [Gemmatimonadales bacterium]|nr:6-bladed beta-propeller [Gemmatimonadales bacterium]NIN11249.1 6-bladed beta-propeller [Gemmatimonadales bacterium]NIN49848.1 6-bladed beta-propeller [Gemmatimonadales bacterium]NIP07312.1 6-bladed beta-propeller [Gemmatimonadales bacterium]NIR03007.1 6-bladed beta-propeller [Gemmatimonadales bacterium]